MKQINSLSDVIGLELVEVTGGQVGDDEIVFKFKDGESVALFHSQECCECVSIEDIDGDIQDLVGGIVVEFEEVSSDYDEQPSEYSDSYTWTFYKIATTKGFVNVRWLGESNGYYSESVDLAIKTGDENDWSSKYGEGWKTLW